MSRILQVKKGLRPRCYVYRFNGRWKKITVKDHFTVEMIAGGVIMGATGK